MACFVGLCPAVGGEFYSVVWDCLVDVAVFWTALEASSGNWGREGNCVQHRELYNEKRLLLPSDCACLIRIIMRGFPILRAVVVVVV